MIEVKSSEIDLVTETDQQVEKLLIDGLSKQFVDHKFIGEESVAGGSQCVLTDTPTWIIDPIDGTMNFVHSFPHSCISIALFVNQKPEIGIIYNPMLNQLFTARKGKGAYLNGKSIRVSGKTNFSDALIMMEFGTSRDPEKGKVVLENQKKLMPQVHGYVQIIYLFIFDSTNEKYKDKHLKIKYKLGRNKYVKCKEIYFNTIC